MRPSQGQGSLHHPSARLNLEALLVVTAADDLHLQDRKPRHGRLDLAGIVADVGPHELEAGEAGPDAVEHEGGAVPVLHPGRVDHDPQRQAFGIDKRVDLAPLHTFAGVVAHLVILRAPFSADLIVWLSSTAALGLASRPRRSRSDM